MKALNTRMKNWKSDWNLMGEHEKKLFLDCEKELAALREAGEKMAEQLREMRDYTGGTFTAEDAAALEAWEAANK